MPSPISIILFILFILVIILLCQNGQTMLIHGGAVNKLNYKKIPYLPNTGSSDNGACNRDITAYTLLVPKESYKLIKSRLYKLPILQKYDNVIRKNKTNMKFPIISNTDCLSYKLTEKWLNIMDLTYIRLKNISLYHKHIRKKKCPDYMIIDAPLEPKIDHYKLIAIVCSCPIPNEKYNHAICLLLCESKYWVLYDCSSDMNETRYLLTTTNSSVPYIKEFLNSYLSELCKSIYGSIRNIYTFGIYCIK